MCDGLTYHCAECGAVYRVLVDEQQDRVAFLAPDRAAAVEPLHLPRGSVRAAVAMLLSAAFWILVVMRAELPPSLMGTLLTILGAYFAFRGHKDPTGELVYDPRSVRSSPLNLPPGAIRGLLTVGFAITGVLLTMQGRLLEPAVLEFFLLVVGLLAGLVVSRGMQPLKATAAYAAWRHVRAAIVLAAAIGIAALSLTGDWQGDGQIIYIGLCAIVTFYFGSRSS